MRLPLPADQLKKLLVAEGLITDEKFQELYTEADRKNQNILDVLIADKIAESDYLNTLIAKALGVPVVNFETRKVEKEMVQLLPEDLARQRQVIIFNREEDGTYDAAMTDPSDLETLQFLAQRLKGKIKPFLAMPEDLNRGFSVYGYQLGQDFKKIIEDNVKASLTSQTTNTTEAAS